MLKQFIKTIWILRTTNQSSWWQIQVFVITWLREEPHQPSTEDATFVRCYDHRTKHARTLGTWLIGKYGGGWVNFNYCSRLRAAAHIEMTFAELQSVGQTLHDPDTNTWMTSSLEQALTGRYTTVYHCWSHACTCNCTESELRKERDRQKENLIEWWVRNTHTRKTHA